MNVTLTREQIRRIDQLAIERYGIAGIVLMENAGRNAAALLRDVYAGVSSALICCGVGNNGGDGFVIGRHLHNAGWSLRLLVLGDVSKMTPDTHTNFNITSAMGIETVVTTDAAAQRATVSSVTDGEVIVDAVLGTGFRGMVRSPTAELIDAINAATSRAVIAIDVPSGLDCNTGESSNATIRADLTVTFVASKVGFTVPAAAPYVGRVEVVDIGAPRELLSEMVSGTT